MRTAVFVVILAVGLAGCTSAEVVGPDPPGGSLTLQGALLLATPYPSLIIEFDYVSGREPRPDAVQEMIHAIRALTPKEDVQVVGPDVIEGMHGDPGRSWNLEQLWAIAATVRSTKLDAAGLGSGASVFLHVLYLDGEYRDERGSARGIQSGNLLGVWTDTLQPANLIGEEGPSFPSEAASETRLLLHELGHAFGLVNCGIPMTAAREHPSSRCHSTNDESVMSAYTDMLDMALHNDHVQTLPSWFDEDDVNDIRAFQADHRG